MKKITATLLIASAAFNCPAALRAPSYPLVTIDPYTSAWSGADNLYDCPVSHWSGTEFPFVGVMKVDGIDYRFMGVDTDPYMIIIENSETGPWKARYTTAAPGADWMLPSFDDSLWTISEGSFGSDNEPFARSRWDSSDIWVRRSVILSPEDLAKPLLLNYSHDDDAEFYINGIKLVDTGNAAKKNCYAKLTPEITATLKAGETIVAAHCHDRGGARYLDLGIEAEPQTQQIFTRTATQKSVQVQPMNTLYEFQCGPVRLKLTFTAPLFMDDLDLMSRPVNYCSYEISAADGRKHNVSLYFEAGAGWAVNDRHQSASAEVQVNDGLALLSIAHDNPEPLKRSGDDVRIDWGRFYLAADAATYNAYSGDSHNLRASFAADTAPAPETGSSVALTRHCGNVSKADGHFYIAYDDEYSLQYFGQNMRPYWNRSGNETIIGQLAKARAQYGELMKKSADFDRSQTAAARKSGGDEYAELCALAYRQAISAHKLIESPEGEPVFLSKENFSNGSIGTVDISYPSCPLFLLYNPELVKGLMNHIFHYSESGRWNKPFAAHDVGTYPLANGQTYGGDMPVEESGNMIIMTAALAAVEGNADYARKHWPTLSVWANYLIENGLDPENQLCTDDFAGHFAHNTNLSIKAIVAIGAYAQLARKLGFDSVADQTRAKAAEMAGQWMTMADDGDHYRLTFDKAGTWSQKYNLVWDKLLGLNLFPDEIAKKELKYYLSRQNIYGLPLDNRETYTKTDWIIWTATMADDNDTFLALVRPIHTFMNETVDRVPMTDWPFTDKPQMRGFQARSVVGGYFIKMLKDRLK